MVSRLLLVVPVVALLSACGGQDCGALPELRAERDAARAAYAELVAAGTASAQETAVADDAVHDLDARVFDAERACASR